MERHLARYDWHASVGARTALRHGTMARTRVWVKRCATVQDERGSTSAREEALGEQAREEALGEQESWSMLSRLWLHGRLSSVSV